MHGDAGAPQQPVDHEPVWQQRKRHQHRTGVCLGGGVRLCVWGGIVAVVRYGAVSCLTQCRTVTGQDKTLMMPAFSSCIASDLPFTCLYVLLVWLSRRWLRVWASRVWVASAASTASRSAPCLTSHAATRHPQVREHTSRSLIRLACYCAVL